MKTIPSDSFNSLWPILVILIGCGAPAQVDENLWLVANGGLAAGTLYQLDGQGNLIGTYAGASLGSSGVAKDLFLGRVWLCDDDASNSVSPHAGRIRLYQAGVGLVASFPAPAIGGIAMLESGDIAAIINESSFTPSKVQVLPSSGIPPPPPITVGWDARKIRGAPGPRIWTLNLISGSVSLVQGPVATNITIPLAGALSDLSVLPGGDVVVSALGDPNVARVSYDGSSVTTISIPEAPLRMTVDADGDLLMIGTSGFFHRINLTSLQVIESWPTGGTSFGNMFPGRKGEVTVEISSAPPRCVRYARGGTVLWSTNLPNATVTFGDPTGLEFAWKAAPAFDLDMDGATNWEEYRRGSDPINILDVPPSLVRSQPVGPAFDVTIDAPGHGGRAFILLCAVNGSTPLSLAPVGYGAPFYDLDFVADPLVQLIATGDPVIAPMFGGSPFGFLDSSGQFTGSMDLSAIAAYPPGTAHIYCAGMVFDSSLQRVEATTRTICFDNQGNSCPVPGY